MLAGAGESFHGEQVSVTAAPGAVFLRVRRRAVVALAELSPGEALTMAADLVRAARIALAADDGRDAGAERVR